MHCNVCCQDDSCAPQAFICGVECDVQFLTVDMTQPVVVNRRYRFVGACVTEHLPHKPRPHVYPHSVTSSCPCSSPTSLQRGTRDGAGPGGYRTLTGAGGGVGGQRRQPRIRWLGLPRKRAGNRTHWRRRPLQEQGTPLRTVEKEAGGYAENNQRKSWNEVSLRKTSEICGAPKAAKSMCLHHRCPHHDAILMRGRDVHCCL